jgi:hypothetical protein
VAQARSSSSSSSFPFFAPVARDHRRRLVAHAHIPLSLSASSSSAPSSFPALALPQTTEEFFDAKDKFSPGIFFLLFFGFYFVSSIFPYSFVSESLWRWC